MPHHSNKPITYPRKDILTVLKTLNEIVVSLDHIADASFDMTKAENNNALSDFIWRHKIMQKSAKARAILTVAFPTELDANGMDELEREMKHIRYWRNRRKKSK